MTGSPYKKVLLTAHVAIAALVLLGAGRSEASAEKERYALSPEHQRQLRYRGGFTQSGPLGLSRRTLLVTDRLPEVLTYVGKVCKDNARSNALGYPVLFQDVMHRRELKPHVTESMTVFNELGRHQILKTIYHVIGGTPPETSGDVAKRKARRKAYETQAKKLAPDVEHIIVDVHSESVAKHVGSFEKDLIKTQGLQREGARTSGRNIKGKQMWLAAVLAYYRGQDAIAYVDSNAVALADLARVYDALEYDSLALCSYNRLKMDEETRRPVDFDGTNTRGGIAPFHTTLQQVIETRMEGIRAEHVLPADQQRIIERVSQLTAPHSDATAPALKRQLRRVSRFVKVQGDLHLEKDALHQLNRIVRDAELLGYYLRGEQGLNREGLKHVPFADNYAVETLFNYVGLALMRQEDVDFSVCQVEYPSYRKIRDKEETNIEVIDGFEVNVEKVRKMEIQAQQIFSATFPTLFKPVLANLPQDLWVRMTDRIVDVNREFPVVTQHVLAKYLRDKRTNTLFETNEVEAGLLRVGFVDALNAEASTFLRAVKSAKRVDDIPDGALILPPPGQTPSNFARGLAEVVGAPLTR